MQSTSLMKLEMGNFVEKNICDANQRCSCKCNVDSPKVYCAAFQGVSICYFATFPSLLSVYPLLFSVCNRSGTKIWRNSWRVERPLADITLPSFFTGRLRSCEIILLSWALNRCAGESVFTRCEKKWTYSEPFWLLFSRS